MENRNQDDEFSLFFRASAFPRQNGNLHLLHNHEFRKLKQELFIA